MSTTVPRWWRHPPLLQRYVSDLIHAELCLMRLSGAGLPPLPWGASTDLETDLGVDSLERQGLAVALASSLQMAGDGADGGLLRAATLEALCVCAAGSLERSSDRITFKTSGSSGVPKSCVHQLDLLWQEAVFFAGQLPAAQRIVCAVPAHHIYGFLFTVLLPLAAQAPVLDARHMLPSALPQQARPGDVIVGFPGYWQALVTASSSAAASLHWPPSPQ